MCSLDAYLAAAYSFDSAMTATILMAPTRSLRVHLAQTLLLTAFREHSMHCYLPRDYRSHTEIPGNLL